MIPLVITPGDPGGVGPDLCIQAALDGNLQGIIVADPKLIKARVAFLGLPVTVIDADHYDPEKTKCVIYVDPITADDPNNPPGISKPANADYCLKSIEHALQGIDSGRFRALVTGPVNKGTIRDAGFTSFTGHTEFLRDFYGLSEVVMMLTSPACRVALVTTHLPLSDVSSFITRERIENVGRIVISSFQNIFQIKHPRIHVLGLNPHAGENGHLGQEELNIICPAIEILRSTYQDVHIEGPLPADTAFTPDLRAITDAYIAMYHDQGLPVVKYQGFGNSVNITLGLPIVRTSVDHGTALNIAGKGIANTAGLIAAIREANQLTSTNV